MIYTLPMAFLTILFAAVALPLIAFMFYSLYRLFEKCNIDGWKAFIPFYNIFILIRLCNLNWWYILVFSSAAILSIDAGAGLSLLCNLVMMITHSLISYNLTKIVNNGKNSHLVDFILETFLPIVYLPVMALNDDFKYIKDVELTPNAYIDEIQTSSFDIHKEEKKEDTCKKCGQVIDKNNKYCPNCGKKI